MPSQPSLSYRTMQQRYVELGGPAAAPTLHLAPANGFPPESYRPLAAALGGRFHVLGYRPRPLWPGSRPEALRRWHELTEDMLADMAGRGLGRVIGAGHSLGGIMTLYAALRRPEHFRGLALIDPVILPRRTLPLVWASRLIGQDHRAPLSQGALRRRDRFASLEEARGRYTGRGAFAEFDPAALEAYLAAGLRPDGDGLTLAWPKAWEARIFAKVPLDTWAAVARLRLPLLLIRGSRSDLIIDRSWAQLRRRLPQARLVELPGGHMVPMEQPAAVAETIAEWAAGLPA